MLYFSHYLFKKTNNKKSSFRGQFTKNTYFRKLRFSYYFLTIECSIQYFSPFSRMTIQLTWVCDSDNGWNTSQEWFMVNNKLIKLPAVVYQLNVRSWFVKFVWSSYIVDQRTWTRSWSEIVLIAECRVEWRFDWLKAAYISVWTEHPEWRHLATQPLCESAGIID